MNMNFFKKVMTFFSIIWNAILWRRTVKDKKSKSVDKGATEKKVPCETERLEVEEEAGKAFVNVPLVTPGVEVFPFGVDLEINLHDPAIVQGVSELSSQIAAQTSNFVGIDTNLLLADAAQTARKAQSNLTDSNGGYERDELNDSPVPLAEGSVLSEIDDLLVDKDSDADIVSGYTDLLCSKNAPIVEAVILQPPVVSFEKLKDESADDLTESVKLDCEEFTVPVRSETISATINSESHELPQLSSRISNSEIEDHNSDLQSTEQDIEVSQDVEKTDSCTYISYNKLTTQHEPGGLTEPLPQGVMSPLEELEEEEMEVRQIDISAVSDKVMSSDGDYVLQRDVLIQEKLEGKNCQELFADDDNWNFLEAKKDEEETKRDHDITDTTLDTPAIVIPGVTTSTADFSSIDILLNQEDRIAHSNSACNEVQTSISSVKLSDNGKYGESSSDLLTSDHSTNYVVRSDSLVNFLPNTRFHEERESPLNVSENAELTDDTVWIEENCIISEPVYNGASATINNNAEQSCLEEIMCTSTGILKLSDSCGNDTRHNSHDPSIKLEDKPAPGNNNEEKDDETPISANDIRLPGVFRCDIRGVVSDLGNRAGVFGHAAQAEPAHQSDPVNFQTKTQDLGKNTKELGHKNHAREESNEHSSTKSENDTLENIDELSYDVNVNTHGEDLFPDSLNSSGRREFEMDPVVVLRRIRSLGHEESARTGSNVPSLTKSEIYFQGSGGNSSGHLNSNIRSNGRQRLQDHSPMKGFDVSQMQSSHVSQNLPNFSFPGEFSPPIIPAEYNTGNIAMPAPSFDVSNVSLDTSIPLVTVGKTNYYETSKWQQTVPCTEQDDAAPVNFDTTSLRFFSKNGSFLYTHMGPENRTINEGSENYGSKVSNEFYPFIDGSSYLFGIPDEIRKEEYFNPCVGAAPSSRGQSKPAENLKFEKLKVLEGYKRDEPNNFMTKSEQNYSMTQRPVPHDLFPIAEGVESNYVDRRYPGKVQIESELVQMDIPQCRVWNAPHQMLPVDTSTPYHNGFDSNEHYSGLENIQPHQVDFVPVDYLQNTVYENDQNTVCSTANGYEFINPYGVGVFPMLNIPFCLPDPSFVARGQVPPFVFPIGPLNMAQDEGPPADLEADDQNSLYPSTPNPYWVGFQSEEDSRAQTDIAMKNELSSADMNRNYALPQISINETVGDEEDIPDECPIPDPYFQLAENSSLHSVKSKAESFNGSLFCESLRSILSSHNAESDNIMPSFSCSSVRCYNPSLVVRSCETSLSNDSLPSIIVEGSYSKSVDDDYPAKEKFMNDVNTALNESMMDQMQENLDECPASFMGRGDFEVELVETADIVPEDIERTLQGIIETDVALEFDKGECTSHNARPVEIREPEEVEDVEESNVNEVLIGILDSVIDNAVRNEDKCTFDGVDCEEDEYQFTIYDDNDVETVNVSAEVEESIVVQHMVHLEENCVNCGHAARLLVDDIEGDIGNGGECGDSNEVVSMVREEAFNDADLKNLDGCENLENDNQENWGLKETDRSARNEIEGGSVCDETEEQVSSNVEISSLEQNMRKSKRNRRRKKKGGESTTEPETVIAPEIGIGDGSKPQEILRLEKVQESASQEVAHFEQTTEMQGSVEEAKAGEDEDQCREDQDGDHEELEESLGNSSYNRKRRNRRKKRKN